MTKKMAVLFATLILCLLVGVWCQASLKTGEVKTERQSVEVGDAKSASVELRLGVGDVKLHGNAVNLMDATFTYNLPEWKPEVKYEVNNSVGKLTVAQPKTQGQIKGRTKNKWDIGLKNDFPLSLSLNMGVGNCEADLEGLSVSSLEVKHGVGSIKVLCGNHPCLAGLDLDSGVGDIDVDLANCTQNLNASINVGTGSIKIRLPRDVGVRIKATKGVGSVNARGFTKQGNSYINDAYGKSSITLSIKASMGVGDITLTQGK